LSGLTGLLFAFVAALRAAATLLDTSRGCFEMYHLTVSVQGGVVEDPE
jgi:hypothetical protein